MERTVTTRAQWLQARKALLAEEKAMTRALDALAAKRRALPLVEVAKPYRFETSTGPKDLAGLFGGQRQLAVYHFMFGSDWAEGCPSCSFWADGFDGISRHLAARDTAFVAVSKAPLDTLLAYHRRMGWSFDWVSAGASGFNEDFGVTLPAGAEAPVYNYVPRPGAKGEMPGLSTFLREGDRVLHGYSTYARGLDIFNVAYQILDLTPLGRHEDGLPWSMAWLRRHDAYETGTETAG